MKPTRTRSLLMGLFLLVGACSAFFACSQSPGSGSDGGIIRRCEDIYIVGNLCDPCLQKECCSELTVCDADCLDCLRGGSKCSDASDAVFRCADKLCIGACSNGTGGGGAGGSATTGGTAGAGGK